MKAINENDEILSADPVKPKKTNRVIEGLQVVYLFMVFSMIENMQYQ